MSDKCTIKETILTPCDSAESIIEHGGMSKAKGVYLWQTVDIDTGKDRRTLFGVKAGEHKNRGIVFNFCPFCGEDLQGTFK